jgi:hypothetical protein
MTLIINGDDGTVGELIEIRPTNREGWVDVVVQPPTRSFVSFFKSLFKRPKRVIRNVPDKGISKPIITGPPGDQNTVIVMTHGEAGSSKLFDEVTLFQNSKLTQLQGQLQDEIIRAQSAEEEKRQVLQGAKSTQKLVDDLKPKERRRFPMHDRSNWGETGEEGEY